MKKILCIFNTNSRNDFPEGYINPASCFFTFFRDIHLLYDNQMILRVKLIVKINKYPSIDHLILGKSMLHFFSLEFQMR